MALQQIKFAPGIDRQDTSVGAVGRWTDSDLTDLDMDYQRKLVVGNRYLQILSLVLLEKNLLL